VPFGQFPFFKKYIRKIGNKLGFTGSEELLPITHVAIFASGTGSNAAKIIEKFSDHPRIRIGLIVCNNPAAKVLLIAKDKGIPSLLIEKEQFFRGDGYLPDLEKQQIRFIVLAGFLWKIPDALLKAFPFRIVNIHPALLPKYGGKGMYGAKVHQAVIDNHDTETGITIHYVDEKYDNGDIIFQAKCPVKENDTAASLAERVAVLEHKYYPEIIESILVA
jgi:phosphoribosylglycinamide formyltransferase-1